jgi:hypothetical protein
MGDLAGLRGLFLTDLRQTRLETALHLAERVGPDDPARAQASAPGQPVGAAPRRGGDLPGHPDLSAVWRRAAGAAGVAAGRGVRRADADLVPGGRRAHRDREPGR